LQLPHWSSLSFPNFPRFRVDEEEKCDSSITMVNGVDVHWRRELVVYPSPATDFVTVELPDQQRGDLFVLNMEGVIVLHHKEIVTKERLKVSDLPAGLYSIEFIPENNIERVVYTKRVVVTN